MLNSTCRTVLLVCLLLTACSPKPDEIVVYSSRAEQLIRPLFELYMQQTGEEIRWTTDKEGPLMQRLKSEGDQTPADLLLTVDAGNLWVATRDDLLQPVRSEALEENVPAHLRDENGNWFGLSVRARTIVYSTSRVDSSSLSSYAALADPEWKGRLCLRTSKKVYNQSLVAMMIAESGEEAVEKIVGGWVANLAAPVFSNDTKVIEAIVAGQCDVGIVNSYYYGRLQQEYPAIPVTLHWPDQSVGGVHVNVSGAGVVRHADNAAGALRLLEWLSSEQAQEQFAGLNLEYPANDSVAVHPMVAGWGEFSQNLINVSRAGELQSRAVQLMDRAGYR